MWQSRDYPSAMLSRQTLTDADRERITNRLRTLATYAPGDRVTVEPSDTGIAYAGKELEGVALTIDDVFWNRNNLRAVPDADDDRYPPADRHDNYTDDHYVELTGDYEYYVHDKVLLTNIEYTFTEDTTYHMSEDALMPWSEYRETHDRVYLLSEGDDKQVWLKPVAEGNECATCGCNMVRESHWDNGVVTAGRTACAACGNVLAQYDP